MYSVPLVVDAGWPLSSGARLPGRCRNVVCVGRHEHRRQYYDHLMCYTFMFTFLSHLKCSLLADVTCGRPRKICANMQPRLIYSCNILCKSLATEFASCIKMMSGHDVPVNDWRVYLCSISPKRRAPHHNTFFAILPSFGNAASGMGNNPLANAFGPDMMARLAAEPKFVPYLADPSFVAKLQNLQRNPNNMQANLSDPRIMEVSYCSLSPMHLLA